MLSAALILAIMVIPFISSISREVLKSVPPAQREGAYALGATRFEAIRAAVFYARTGIIGAVMLGFGRALGETMAVTMVIGNNPKVSVSLFAPQYTMAAVVANEFAEAADQLYLSALVEIGLVLFIITLIINSMSRLLIWSMARTETVVAEPVDSRRPRHDADQRRKLLSSLFVGFCAGAVLLALIPLAFVLFFVISQGIQSLNLAFFTHMPTPVGEAGGGMANSIVGTLILSGLAALMAVPIGVDQRHLHVGVRRQPLRRGGAVRRRYAQRRAVDRDRRCSPTSSRCCRSSSSARWPAASRSG